ncbi:MAG: hypothetical protein IJU19_09180 [Bacteroidales bacterium]|nr:hypothetical protein [Bacteroidales bacterium]
MNIPRGNSLTLALPMLTTADGQNALPLDTSQLSNATACLTRRTTGEQYPDLPLTLQDNLALIQLPATLPCGDFSLSFEALYLGQSLRIHHRRAFTVVEYADEVDTPLYTAPLALTLTPSLFIAPTADDEATAALRANLLQKTAEAEAARATYDAQAAALIQAAAALSNPATLTISPITNADLEAAF